MEAKELRIGNWVNWEVYKGNDFGPQILNDLTIEPIEVDPDIILALYRGATHYFPIPLSPEILEKAGIKESKDFKGVFSKLAGKGKIFFSIIRDTKGKFSYVHTPQRVDILYVHQLQNLYYALTGTNLSLQL